MSLRMVLWLAVLVLGGLWMLRRPLVGVCLGVVFFVLNPAQFGTGLDYCLWC